VENKTWKITNIRTEIQTQQEYIFVQQ